jgi:DNA repair protein RadC
MMQIQLLDHIIIGNGSFSFADNGLMTEIGKQCRETMESLHSSV